MKRMIAVSWLKARFTGLQQGDERGARGSTRAGRFLKLSRK